MATTGKSLQLRELKDTILQLNLTLATQNQLIATLQESLAAAAVREEEHAKQEAALMEQIDFLTKKLFGTSSERREDSISGQLHLFDEAEQEQNPEIPEPEVRIPSHTRKAKTRQEEKLKGIPVKRILLTLPEEEQICSECKTPLKVIGYEVVRRELEYIPAKVRVIEYQSTHYGCPDCKQTDEPYIRKATSKKPLMKHSLASPSTVAWVMYQKYANGLPLYRQEKDWKQYGIALSRTTLANWIIYCASHYLKPMYEYFHRLLLKREHLMADETRIQVLKEPDRKAETDSFMWLYRSGEDGLPVLLLYQYTQTRAGAHAADFLSGYEGYLMCDGYQGYNKVPKIKRCCCWAHVRRYFIDAVPKGKQYDYCNPAVQGVQFCNKLFQLEEIFEKKDAPYEKRKEMRLEKEKPILEAFWSWLDLQQPIRNTRMEKAITYVKNRKQYLETYLEDGRCSLSNNLSENAIRPFTVGRKNWLFSDSTAGAEASAIVYSMVEMAKANDLNIYNYLSYLLEQRPSKEMPDDQLELLAPWNEEVIEHCRNKR